MSYGLLLIRVVLGGTMAAHGSQKLFGWFDGPGPQGTAGFCAGLGFSAPFGMAVLAGAAELGGGLLLAVGLATPVAAFAIAARSRSSGRERRASERLRASSAGDLRAVRQRTPVSGTARPWPDRTSDGSPGALRDLGVRYPWYLQDLYVWGRNVERPRVVFLCDERRSGDVRRRGSQRRSLELANEEKE